LAVERFVRVPVVTAFGSAAVASALRLPSSSLLANGIVTATVALVSFLLLSLAFNRVDLVAVLQQLRSLTLPSKRAVDAPG
jgi:hypothetical protein